MKPEERIYAAVDLKSFYASVECQERGLDPLNVNLVVADESRTDKTICLAVSPALKSYGIPGRARLFEVKRAVEKINRKRREKIGMYPFRGLSAVPRELEADPWLEMGFHIAVPRMACYIQYSTRIYDIYLRYIAPEDIHVYSIDEVIMDLTDYLRTYRMGARELTVKMIREVLSETGITAAAGIGTNMYLAKAAMDIVAKHMPADSDGVRIAELDEESYRRILWDHTPLTDFWRIGRGTASKLEKAGLHTMGEIAAFSLQDGKENGEDVLFGMFGVNAELIIDHAWGREPCTMADIKGYRPRSNSLGAGQVLSEPYSSEKARLVVKEMCDQLALDLVEKGLVTDEISLAVGYDCTSEDDGDEEETVDWYGRRMPKGVHAGVRLNRRTSSSVLLRQALMELYDSIVNPLYLVRRLTVTAGNVVGEEREGHVRSAMQCDLFSDQEEISRREEQLDEEIAKEKKMQKAIVELRRKYGKNIIVRGMDLEEGATARERNGQIGGHKA